MMTRLLQKRNKIEVAAALHEETDGTDFLILTIFLQTDVVIMAGKGNNGGELLPTNLQYLGDGMSGIKKTE